MIRVEVMVVAEDANEAADVLREIVAAKVAEGYTLGFERNENAGRYRFEVMGDS